jgi:hypothetical protein
MSEEYPEEFPCNECSEPIKRGEIAYTWYNEKGRQHYHDTKWRDND